MKVDTLNWNILACLQQNARQSNTKIAQQVGITSPAVAERIHKMEDLGIIEGYYAKVSHFETGHQLKAIITLRAFMGRLKPFIEKVPTFEEVINSTITSIMLLLFCPSRSSWLLPAAPQEQARNALDGHGGDRVRRRARRSRRPAERRVRSWQSSRRARCRLTA